MKRTSRFDPLVSPWFLLSLFLLLLNDHLLKVYNSSWFTGKLSDLAGLFAFTTIALVLLPRHRAGVMYVIGASFSLWKSPAVDPVLIFWNALGYIQIDRVVDMTDLIALLMIPIALLHFENRIERPAVPFRLSRILVPPVLLVTFISFAATSCLRGFEYDGRYPVEGSAADIMSALRSLEADSTSELEVFLMEDRSASVNFSSPVIPGDTNELDVVARVDIEGKDAAVVRLRSISFYPGAGVTPNIYNRLPPPCRPGIGCGKPELTAEQQEGRRTVRSTLESVLMREIQRRSRPPVGRVGTPD